MRTEVALLDAEPPRLEREAPKRGAAFANRRRPKILIATDAWRPQVNGVVRTLEGLLRETPTLGVDMVLIAPDRFVSVPMPSYPEIRLALASASSVGEMIDAERPDAIHIATEGPIGLAARRACLRRGRAFTTCYHTRFPEYAAARFPLPLAAGYAAMRWFHRAASATMVATASLEGELRARGFAQLRVWRRGIDVETFAAGVPKLSLPKPIFMTVCRVAVETNLEAFLGLDLPGSKVVVGDGPARRELQLRFPRAHFLGAAQGRQLADLYASADAFVFPSRTDTYGLVILEALSAGVPVAAFPDGSARDVLGDSACGMLDFDLRRAALAALEIPCARCRAFAATHTMRESARSFLRIVEEALQISFEE